MADKKPRFTRYDTADYLDSEEMIAAYLDAVAREGDPQIMAIALGDVARARGMSALARETGISRQGLTVALSGRGNPSFATVMKVARALGLTFSIQPQALNASQGRATPLPATAAYRGVAARSGLGPRSLARRLGRP